MNDPHWRILPWISPTLVPGKNRDWLMLPIAITNCGLARAISAMTRGRQASISAGSGRLSSRVKSQQPVLLIRAKSCRRRPARSTSWSNSWPAGPTSGLSSWSSRCPGASHRMATATGWSGITEGTQVLPKAQAVEVQSIAPPAHPVGQLRRHSASHILRNLSCGRSDPRLVAPILLALGEACPS